MRSNSISIRLNYSSTWSNKIIFNRDYAYNIKKNFILYKYLYSIFYRLRKYVIFSNIFIKLLLNNKIYLYVYININKFEKLNRFIKRGKKIYIFFIKNMYKMYISRINYLFNRDIVKIYKNRLYIKYIFVRKRYYTADTAANYIVDRLASNLKLDRVMRFLGKNLIKYKYKYGAIFVCSGRFDRKQRARFKTFIFGKISLNTLKNNISYSSKSVVLKYGICGIKSWVI